MPDCLLLTHGAGSHRDAPLLKAVDEALRDDSLEVVRLNLPFREARPGGPPRPGDAEGDRAGLLDAALRAKAESGGRVFLGGHSYGGRQSSMLAAENPDVLSGLLLLSYPLHPPRKPQQLRTAHFPALRTPCLFVHGSRDPFGSADELQTAIAAIPCTTELLIIEGAGHELAPRRVGAMAETAAIIARAFRTFFA